MVYVAGNHEHYEGILNDTDDIICRTIGDIGTNIHYLHNEFLNLGEDIVIAGGTLWTNLNNWDPLTEFHLPRIMNDYSRIEYRTESGRYRKLSTVDTVECHTKTMQFLKDTADKNSDKKN